MPHLKGHNFLHNSYTSASILMAMLYKEKRYDDVIKVYRKLIQINNANKNKQFSFESAKLKNFFSLDSFRILADAMLLKVNLMEV